MKDLNVKFKTIKFLEESTEVTINPLPCQYLVSFEKVTSGDSEEQKMHTFTRSPALPLLACLSRVDRTAGEAAPVLGMG